MNTFIRESAHNAYYDIKSEPSEFRAEIDDRDD